MLSDAAAYPTKGVRRSYESVSVMATLQCAHAWPRPSLLGARSDTIRDRVRACEIHCSPKGEQHTRTCPSEAVQPVASMELQRRRIEPLTIDFPPPPRARPKSPPLRGAMPITPYYSIPHRLKARETCRLRLSPAPPGTARAHDVRRASLLRIVGRDSPSRGEARHRP